MMAFDHRGLWCNVLPGDRIALIAPGLCAPSAPDQTNCAELSGTNALHLHR